MTNERRFTWSIIDLEDQIKKANSEWIRFKNGLTMRELIREAQFLSDVEDKVNGFCADISALHENILEEQKRLNRREENK